MYCPKCGSKIADDAKFCPTCGNKIETAEQLPITPSLVVEKPAVSTLPAQIQNSEPGASGMAIGSLVLGILCLVFGWVPVLGIILSVTGTVLGGIALSKHLNGHGQAAGGLVCSIIGDAWGLIYSIILIAAAVNK
jgi:RNA polymerase subunit RPABC4/transcription elongation factor Spt4